MPNSTNRRTNSNSVIANSNKGKKNRRRQRKMEAVVQRLCDTCNIVFASCGTGIVPSDDNINWLRRVLDQVTPNDFDLTPDMPYFRALRTEGTQPITYLHLYNCDKFSMGIFCLPRSGVIPLHNHPGMTVFSKLLFGTMHIKSLDWEGDAARNTLPVANVSEGLRPEVRLAKVKVDSDFTAPCQTSILFPADGGNMHCFTAVTACAVLDVLGPPYDRHERHCTYYLEFPFSTFSGDGVSVPEEEKDGYAWLQEREGEPKDSTVEVRVWANNRWELM
ncbi:hypothetical protein SLEP1_g10275 [Rubroshorea leprosula]|uniref:cysteine dioxygenase n=2 Tax=Rubroshorea leprosula TaxID=152421 RepID=A0AAV5IGU1_9ROSI|nr:hypothetical protein SLEP1_g10275 [Rubroshorea leprosula]